MKKSIELTVNGKSHRVEVDTRMVLADMLREHLRLTGTHIGKSGEGTGYHGLKTKLTATFIMFDEFTEYHIAYIDSNDHRVYSFVENLRLLLHTYYQPPPLFDR